MVTATIPQTFEAMTPAWLTEVLAAARRTGGAMVTDVSAVPIGQGVGILCQLARLSLAYDGPAPGAPHSLVVKIPSADPATRQLAHDVFHFYECEVAFYQQLAADLAISTPACYYATVDAATGDFVLLLEDLDGMRLGDQIAGCPAADLEVMVPAIARHHAAWWNNPRLADLTWIPLTSAPVRKAGVALYSQAWPQFVATLGGGLPPEMLRIGEQLGSHTDAILDRFAAGDLTFCHGDYRVDNVFFATRDGEPAMRLLDWQLVTRGIGTYDIGYLMSQSVNVDVRRKHEQDLVRLYHCTLVENGVEGYSFETCWEDYRWAILFCFAYPVFGGGFIDPVNDRAVALFTAMTERSATAILDLKVGELIA